MEGANPNFEDLALIALAEYALGETSRTFLQHSDTVSYKVENAAGEAYLLRLHVPVTEAMGSHGASFAAMTSEMLWLEALCQDTDLELQQPIRNQLGALVTQIQAEENSKQINCTLLRWLPGERYHRELETEDTARQIGHILGTLHNHTEHWKIPNSFTRPRRDRTYFAKVLEGIYPAVKDGRISREDFSTLGRSIAKLVEMMPNPEERQGLWGLLHGDAHKGNMLFQDGQIHLIDFSFCSFGNYLFDLGVCLSDMKPILHPAFLEGYENLRSLADGYQRMVEGFFVGSIVGTFSFWVPNPQAQEALAKRLPMITRKYAKKFNRNEPFWFID